MASENVACEVQYSHACKEDERNEEIQEILYDTALTAFIVVLLIKFTSCPSQFFLNFQNIPNNN